MKTENINIENSENISKKDLTEKQLNLLISIADELDKEAKYETALEKLNEAFLKYENSEVFPELSANIKTDILFQIATLNLIIKNLQTSENYFIKVIEWNEKNNITDKNASSYHNLGNIFAIQKKWNKALENYELAIDANSETSNFSNLNKTFFNLRIILAQTLNIKKRLKYYKKRLKLYEKQEKVKLFGYFYHELALLYADYDDKKNEKKYFKKALSTKQEHKIEFEIGSIYYFLADFYDNDDEDEKAFEYYTIAFEYMLKNAEYQNAGPTFQYLKLSLDECANPELKQKAIDLIKLAEERKIFDEKKTIFNGIEIGEYVEEN